MTVSSTTGCIRQSADGRPIYSCTGAMASIGSWTAISTPRGAPCALTCRSPHRGGYQYIERLDTNPPRTRATLSWTSAVTFGVAETAWGRRVRAGADGRQRRVGRVGHRQRRPYTVAASHRHQRRHVRPRPRRRRLDRRRRGDELVAPERATGLHGPGLHDRPDRAEVSSIVRAAEPDERQRAVSGPSRSASRVTRRRRGDFVLAATGPSRRVVTLGHRPAGATSHTVTADTGTGGGTLASTSSTTTRSRPRGQPARRRGAGNSTTGPAYTVDKAAPDRASTTATDADPTNARAGELDRDLQRGRHRRRRRRLRPRADRQRQRRDDRQRDAAAARPAPSPPHRHRRGRARAEPRRRRHRSSTPREQARRRRRRRRRLHRRRPTRRHTAPTVARSRARRQPDQRRERESGP